jgi:hypothetical protein
MIAGQPWNKTGGPELYWFENPGDPDKEWAKRIICSDLDKYHDQAIGDVDGDGKDELVFASQGAKVVGYYDIPEDPRVNPWPVENRHIIDEDIVAEGLLVVDVDQDGQNEIMAGPAYYKKEGDSWKRYSIDDSFQLTRVAVADLTGDGKNEVVIAEGESNPARLAWFSGGPDWKMHPLADDLFHPHSMELADFTGDGKLDIFVAEMGLGKNPDPKVLIYINKGNGKFERYVVDENCATHEAKVGDIGKSGRPSIVGKPYDPGQAVHLWLNKG